MEQPNKQILLQFIQGDPNAADQIYRFYRTPVIRYGMAIIKDAEEAENIYHEVFVKIMKRSYKINPDMNFNAYIFTAIKNEIFDYFKKVKKNNELKEQYWNNIFQEDQQEIIEKETKFNKLEELIGDLSPKRKLVLEKNIYEEKSYQEIADELSISKNTVKNQLIKAKALLRQSFN
ncbi:RNA polymerase sigma factor [Echinicola shivajiensis]|uniref:RNA polymerase sigma factor n=1 Tax=Echinicola shivajiensis TaxID=1035916 RepID=UPI001BFC439C|nr:sigma-70 family RNA polymerase sigma factor [Echinicola shivajiensis]